MADPKQARLSPADRRARDRLMREEHDQGATLEALAQRFGVSVATVKRGISRARTLSAEEQLYAVDPANELVLILDAQRAAIRALIREMDSADSSSARVGACKATAVVGQGLRDTLASAGHLPGKIVNPTSSGDELRWKREMDEIVNAFLDVADRTGIDWEAVEREMEEAGVVTAATQG
jgi:AraC-like DNA-binding protein